MVDLFREWDKDGSGSVSKKEFRKAMPQLGLDAPKAEIDLIFDSWDPDGSGVLELAELNKLLRKQAAIPAHMQVGSVAFEREAKNRIAARKGRSAEEMRRAGTGLNIDIDENSELSLGDQLRLALERNAMRVVDLFREWDDDASGRISKKEFRRALPAIGCKVPRAVADLVFDAMDPDGSGEIDYRELRQNLRNGASQRTLAQLSEMSERGECAPKPTFLKKSLDMACTPHAPETKAYVARRWVRDRAAARPTLATELAEGWPGSPPIAYEAALEFEERHEDGAALAQEHSSTAEQTRAQHTAGTAEQSHYAAICCATLAQDALRALAGDSTSLKKARKFEAALMALKRNHYAVQPTRMNFYRPLPADSATGDTQNPSRWETGRCKQGGPFLRETPASERFMSESLPKPKVKHSIA